MSNNQYYQKYGIFSSNIFLVISFLALSGFTVLQTNQLIDSARLKSIVIEYDNYKSAIRSFKHIYSHLPGNIPSSDLKKSGMKDIVELTEFTERNGEISGNNKIYAGYSAKLMPQHLLRSGIFKQKVEYIKTSDDLNKVQTISDGAGVYFPRARFNSDIMWYATTDMTQQGRSIVPSDMILNQETLNKTSHKIKLILVNSATQNKNYIQNDVNNTLSPAMSMNIANKLENSLNDSNGDFFVSNTGNNSDCIAKTSSGESKYNLDNSKSDCVASFVLSI